MSERDAASGSSFWADAGAAEPTGRYRGLVNAIADGIYQLDAEGRFVGANDAFAETTGYDREALFGRHVSLVHDEATVERLERALRGRLGPGEGETDATVDATIETADGGVLRSTVRATPPGPDGDDRGLVCVVRDAERPDRERELQRYEVLVTESGDVNAVLNPDGSFRYLPPSTEDVLGYGPGELIDEDAFSYVHPDDRERVRREFERLVEDPDHDPTIEFRYEHADGRWVVLEANGRNLLDDPAVEGIVAYTRDVTERTEVERELREKERRYEAVFEDPNILVGLLEPDGTVLDINRTAMEYIDADLPDVVGEPFWETPWWGEGDDVRSDVREWTERAATGEYVDFEADLTRPDGQRYTLSGYFRPVTNDDGDVVSIIVSDRDVTERKRRERDLEESERRYRTLVEHFPNGAVGLVDDELRYRTVGGSPLDVADLTADELEGRPVREVLPTTLADELVPRYEAALDGDSGDFEIELGDRIYRFQVVPVRDDDGDVFAALGMSQDVTERNEYRRRTEKSERRYRTLAEYFPNGIVTLFDHDFEYTLAAGQGFDDIPVDPAEVEGEYFGDVWDDETADALESSFEAALEGQERSVELEYGGREWLVRSAPITDERGDVFAGMTMAQDITEQKERERYFEDAKAQLEAATEAGAVGTWEWHVPDDRFVAGASFAKTFGVDPDGAREGVSLDEFVSSIHPADRDRVERQIEAALESCGEYEAEYRVRNADGDVRWVVARGHVECDEDGAPVRFPGAITDITDRKRAELELDEQRKQLETLFEVLPVGVVVADADGRLVEANDAAREIWGGDVFDADRVADYDRFRGWWADTGEPVAPDEWTMGRVLEGEEVLEPDVFEVEAADGERRTVMVHGMPVRNGDGEVVRGVVTQTDVTERREAQRRLAESERRYRSLVENFPNGAVGLFDESLEYTVVGGEMIDDLDIPADELVGMSARERYPGDVAEMMERNFRAALAGETNSFEMELHGRDWFVTTVPVGDSGSDVSAGMVLVQDVTERKEYRRKLEASNERLEQFAYAVSHDLQEPLRMVTSYLQLLERRYDDDLDGDAREFIDFAVDGAERMREMIEGLLTYSRVETRGDPLEPVDLDAVLDDVRTDLAVRIEETDARVDVDELPRVRGDASQLRQLFQNLLSNAIEYSGDGPPRVEVTADRDGSKWVVSVSDEGIGIDPDDQDRIFEVFQRLHDPEDRDGTGIGLALCKRIAKRHGGDVRVDSEPGGGATFSVALPTVDDGEG